MKQTCLICGRSVPDRNLYCQETYCPGEMSPLILERGEWLGDIEILRPVSILRSTTLYEAFHQKQRVLLAVAHPSAQNRDRLKRQAEFLRDLQRKREYCEGLPTLLPPYAYTTLEQDAYGKTMLQEHLLYYCIFKHFDGDALRDVLTKRPQWWINHIAWLMIGLGSVVNFAHLKGRYLYGIPPEAILVRFDSRLGVPRIQLCDFGIAGTKEDFANDWYPYFVPPAYTAPELLGHRDYPTADYRTDVHGLGLILYEMLIGKPAFTYQLRSDADVYQAVGKNQRVRMNREEDVAKVAAIAMQAVHPDPQQRQPSAADFVEQLKQYFGPIPEEKQRRWPRTQTLLMVVGALLAIAFLVALAATVSGLVK